MDKSPFTIDETLLPKSWDDKDKETLKKEFQALANKALLEHNIAIVLSNPKEGNASADDKTENSKLTFTSQFAEPNKYESKRY